MGHPQPQIPIHVDNTTTVGIVNNSIKRQKSRGMEMRYFWLRQQEAQKMFKFHHHPGQENLGDYHTKSHKARKTNHVRPYYTHTQHSPKYLARVPKPNS